MLRTTQNAQDVWRVYEIAVGVTGDYGCLGWVLGMSDCVQDIDIDKMLFWVLGSLLCSVFYVSMRFYTMIIII